MNEFVKFRKLLDMNGIRWHDASDSMIRRTHGEGFSCVFGKGTYGYEDGLLELALGRGDGCCKGMNEPEGRLTAETALGKIMQHDGSKIVKIY